ncbi:MAG: hypothetical protein ACXW2P_08645 [Thermoanaerobaculia bacterium]
MKAKIVVFAALLAFSCGAEQELSKDTLLWRVDRWDETAPGVRVAMATILSFRSSGEFVELHCRVLERADQTVYVASDSPRLTIVGTWTREGDTVTAKRLQIKRPNPFSGPRDPLCDETLTFQVAGKSVTGKAGEETPGTYSPVTRLVAPEFESYASEARDLGASCVVPEAE